MSLQPGPTMFSMPRELWAFVHYRKKYWLLPLIILMLMLGGLVVLTKGTAVAPFIYRIF